MAGPALHTGSLCRGIQLCTQVIAPDGQQCSAALLASLQPLGKNCFGAPRSVCDRPALQPGPLKQQACSVGCICCHLCQDIQNDVLPANASITVRQACFLLLESKQKRHVRDSALDVLLQTLSNLFLPRPNLLPPSLYLLEHVMQSRTPNSCMCHACSRLLCLAVCAM